MQPTNEEVRSAAQRLFRTEQAAEAWLGLHNERLGAAPNELLEAGRGDEVLAELRLIAEQAGPETPDRGLPRWISELFGSRSRK